MRKLLLATLMTAISMLSASHAEAADAIGKVAVLTGSVTATSEDGVSVKLKAGDSIYENQTITTGDTAKTQLIFNDKSIITVGKNAEMLLDEYVYDPASGEGKSFVEMSRGIFKFVTGKIAKNDPKSVKMNTPFATIGVRGSGGIIEVSSSGLTTLSMTNCCINITPRGAEGGASVELTKVNTYSTVSSSGSAPTAPKPVPASDLARLQAAVNVPSDGSSDDTSKKAVKKEDKKATKEKEKSDAKKAKKAEEAKVTKSEKKEKSTKAVTAKKQVVQATKKGEPLNTRLNSKVETLANNRLDAVVPKPVIVTPVIDTNTGGSTGGDTSGSTGGNTGGSGGTGGITPTDPTPAPAPEPTPTPIPVPDPTPIPTPIPLSLVDRVLQGGTDLIFPVQKAEHFTASGTKIGSTSVIKLRTLEVNNIQKLAYELSTGERGVLDMPAPGSDSIQAIDGTEFRVVRSSDASFMMLVENNPTAANDNTVIVLGNEIHDRSGAFDATFYETYKAVIKSTKDGTLSQSGLRMYVDSANPSIDPRALGGEVKFGGASGSVMKMFSARVNENSAQNALDGSGYSFATKNGAATSSGHTVTESTLYGTDGSSHAAIEANIGDSEIVFVNDTTIANTTPLSSNSLIVSPFHSEKVYSAGFKTGDGSIAKRLASRGGEVFVKDSGAYDDYVYAKFDMQQVGANNVTNGAEEVEVKFNSNATVVSKQVYGSELTYSKNNNGSYNTVGEGALLSSKFVDTTGINNDCKNCQFVTWGVWAAELNDTTTRDILQLVPYVAGTYESNVGSVTLPSGVTQATYNGVLAGSISNGSTVTNHLGNFSADVDFANRKVGNFNGDLGGYDLKHSAMDATVGHFDGTDSGFSFALDDTSNVSNGSVNGALFGPGAEEIGGQVLFDTKDSKEGAGVFAGER